MSQMSDSLEEPVRKAVENARNELSGLIESLTTVLRAVAEKERVANGQEPSSRPAQHSMSGVMQRVKTLKDAVFTATEAGANRERAARAQEDAVLPAEREALVRRRDELMDEVKQKNVKVKILIDELRELHRDITVLQSVYYPLAAQERAR